MAFVGVLSLSRPLERLLTAFQSQHRFPLPSAAPVEVAVKFHIQFHIHSGQNVVSVKCKHRTSLFFL